MRVLIAGYVGFRNLGDEAMLEGSLALVRRAGLGDAVTVLSGNPRETAERYGVAAAALGDLGRVAEAVAGSDLVLWGGGSIVHDYWGFRPSQLYDGSGHAPACFLRIPFLAELYGRPCLVWGQGFAPLHQEATDRALRAALGLCPAAFVRDAQSAQELQRLGYRGAVWEGPDLAAALAPLLPVPSPPPRRTPPMVAVCLRPWEVDAPGWEERVTEGLRGFAARRRVTYRFVALQHEPDFDLTDDVRVGERLARALGGALAPGKPVRPATPAEAVGLLGEADLVLGMRYHAAVFAALAGRPVVTLAYDQKVRSLAEALVPPECRLELGTADPAAVAQALERALERREELSERSLAFVRAAGPALERAERLLDAVRDAQSASSGTAERRRDLLRRFGQIPGAVRPALGDPLARLAAPPDPSAADSVPAALLSERAARIAALDAQLAQMQRRFEALVVDREREVTTLRFEVKERDGALRARGEELASALGISEERRVAKEQARREAEDWKRAHDNAVAIMETLRGEVELWRRSRLGRLSAFSWRQRRRLSLQKRRLVLGWQRLSGAFRRAPVAHPPAPATSAEVGEAATGGLALPAASPPGRPTGRYDVVVFSIIDWDSRFQRPQRIATQFGRAGHRVLYLSTTEFLPPGGPAGAFIGKAPGVTEVKIRSRRALDIHGGPLTTEDLEALEDSFRELAAQHVLADAVVLVQISFWAPLAARLRDRLGWRVVYDCMDEATTLPGFGSDVLALEEDLVRTADVTVVSAEPLEQKWRGRARRMVLAADGVDLESPDDPRRERPREVAAANDWRRCYEAIDAAVSEAYPLVSVVVVTYGGLKLTRECLRSLLEDETWPRFEVIVVDNASSDETRPYLEALAARDHRARAFFNPENRGFAAANNVGIRESRGAHVVLLNNDTVVPPGLLGRLVAHLERDPLIGLLCPTTNFCGNEAKVDPDYSDLSGLPAYAARRAWAHAGRIFDVGVAAMYCVAARRETLDRVGPLDEAFGVGMFEDDDFSVRIRREGLRVVCAEDAYVHHVGQASFSKLSAREYQEIWQRNQAYFERKWGTVWKPHRTRKGVVSPASKVT